MPKCRTCNENEATWAWQPFGPNDTPDSFALLGSHYRGYAVVKVCDDCKRLFQVGNALVFKFQSVLYKVTNRGATKGLQTMLYTKTIFQPGQKFQVTGDDGKIYLYTVKQTFNGKVSVHSSNLNETHSMDATRFQGFLEYLEAIEVTEQPINFKTLYDTPNGQTLPRLDQIKAELSRLPIQELWGIADALRIDSFPPDREGVLTAIASELELFYGNYNRGQVTQ